MTSNDAGEQNPVARRTSRAVLQRQILVVAVFVVLSGSVLAILYFKDRDQEWQLHREQATHRIELAREIVVRELEQVLADTLFLAEEADVRGFAAGDETLRERVEAEFSGFVKHKQRFDQIRIVNLSGKELIRIEYANQQVNVVSKSRLQDKSERYYIRNSLELEPGELFVSEFDLNQEHGRIEQPLNPVIRFVTPISGASGEPRALLVLNVFGAPLLDGLRQIALPGQTLLFREDGEFLLGPGRGDSWGWLLGHSRRFDNRFPDAWNHVWRADGRAILTRNGVFAARRISLRDLARGARTGSMDDAPANETTGGLLVASWIPREQVFSDSTRQLRRLASLAAGLLIPLLLLSRYWVAATVRSREQNRRIAESELRLRELSSRLLRIQEEERRAISREIHDEFGQQATAIRLDLKLAERAWQTESGRLELQRAIRYVDQLLATLHDFAGRIRPSVLDDLGLTDAVESYLHEFRERTGLRVHLDARVDGHNLPPVVAENVYRLIQESLNNVLKHANAGEVSVSMNITDAGGTRRFCMAVADDGQGAAGSANGHEGLGIVGMKERVDLIGGSLRIDSSPGAGTTVNVLIPLDSHSPLPHGKKP